MLFAAYHQSLIDFGNGRKKSQDIQAAQKILDFIEVAKLFRVIDEAGQGVVVRYGEADAILTKIHDTKYLDIQDVRLLQRFTVNLYPTWVAQLSSLNSSPYLTATAPRTNTSQSTTMM